jgi:WD40 repeat protein
MTLVGHNTRVTGVAFAPSGDWLASVDRDRNVIIWDLAERRPRLGFDLTWRGRAETHCLVVSPDGRWVALSQGIYESSTGRQVVGFDGAAGMYGLTFSLDGRLVALADWRGNLLLWDTGTWQVAYQANITPTQLISVSFSPDGEWLVTGEDQGTVRLWSARPLRQVAELGRHKARVKSVAFSSDGKEVVSASDDKTSVCRTPTGVN